MSNFECDTIICEIVEVLRKMNRIIDYSELKEDLSTLHYTRNKLLDVLEDLKNLIIPDPDYSDVDAAIDYMQYSEWENKQEEEILSAARSDPDAQPLTDEELSKFRRIDEIVEMVKSKSEKDYEGSNHNEGIVNKEIIKSALSIWGEL